jgi:C-terminal processing protease CtpA/Prc
MRSIITFAFLLLFQSFAFGQSPKITTEQYKQDFDFFWTRINDQYCYFDKTHTNWQKVKEIYSPIVDTITGRNQFVTILEKAFNEIYDHHAVLNTNTTNSNRLVPSGTDIWAAYINGKPIITELRKGFGAEGSGILPGMEVIMVNDIPVESAIAAFLPKSPESITNEAKCFALRLLLAGNHIQPRKFTLKYRNVVKDFFPDTAGLLLEHIKYPVKIESKLIDNIGYIKINDCLYDNKLIPVFDSIMQTFKNTKSLILDFRETPSGGNTSVAKAIIGWFIGKEHFYQKHEYYAEEKSSGIKRSWVEIVSPRKGKYYSKPLVILCNHWTGSIGEGIIIGFDALNRPNTKIIGTEMARLKGAVYTFEMPNTKIQFTFPVERLYHVNGLPREQYIPPIFIDWRKWEEKQSRDEFLVKAMQYLKNK